MNKIKYKAALTIFPPHLRLSEQRQKQHDINNCSPRSGEYAEEFLIEQFAPVLSVTF